jgi:hypothetical protein
MSLVALVIHFGTLFLVLGFGIWLEMRTGAGRLYRALPDWASFVVAGVAFGLPWIPYWRGAYPETLPPDPLHWVLALNAILWITTPVLLARYVGPGRSETAC